jgi:peptidoglycan/LPS O-acetylase OafA/YrhL
LTGIRGIAAAWVFLLHLSVACGGLPGLTWLREFPIIGSGWSGVDLFFVLSGFVLMRTHSQEFARLRLAPVVSFAKLRFARVYPVSAVVLLLIVFLSADHDFVAACTSHVVPGCNLSRRSFVETALLATRWFLPRWHGDWNPPTWSLSVEILGYAAFPLIAVLFAKRSWNSAVAIAIACIGALVTLQLLLPMGPDDTDQRAAFIRMACCFTAGAALARAAVNAPAGFADKSATLSVLAVLLVLAGCLVPQLKLALPLAYAVLILSLAFRRGPVDRALSTRHVEFLGKISFPLYLVHLMPMWWLGVRLRAMNASAFVCIAAVLLYVALAIGAATLLHFAVERPSHRWGRRWAGGLASKRGEDVGTRAVRLQQR